MPLHPVLRKLRDHNELQQHEFDNGAVMYAITEPCQVCLHENQEPQDGVFQVEFEGSKLDICEAHATKLLEAEEDAKKGGLLEEYMSFV